MVEDWGIEHILEDDEMHIFNQIMIQLEASHRLWGEREDAQYEELSKREWTRE